MKRILLKALLTISLCSTPAYAELYKGVDADGNVVYSDKPFKNAESITPPAISVMDAPKNTSAKSSTGTATAEPDEAKPTTYTRLRITSPANNETLWNQDSFNVNMSIEPSLAVKEGHSITLLMDGKIYIRDSGSPNFVISRPVRGPHVFQGVVRDKSGKVLIRSQRVQVHIKQHSVQKKAR